MTELLFLYTCCGVISATVMSSWLIWVSSSQSFHSKLFRSQFRAMVARTVPQTSVDVAIVATLSVGFFACIALWPYVMYRMLK